MGNPKTLQEQLLDSFIVATISFFSVMVGVGYPPNEAHLFAAVMAFSLAFFTQWASERGVKRQKKKRNP